MKDNKSIIIGIIAIIIVVLAITVPYVLDKAGINVDFSSGNGVSFKVEKRTTEAKESTTEKTTTTGTTTKVTTTKKVENEQERLNVYVFYGETCPHCSALHAYFDELETKEIGKKINIHYYEVWNSTANQRLLETVAKELNTEVGGVPFFVIGNKHYEGYAESMNDTILKALNDPKSREYDVMNAID